MQKIALISVTLFCVLNLCGQVADQKGKNYHLIYVELSDNNNRIGLTDNLRELYENYTNDSTKIITFLSNATKGQFFQGTKNIQDLFLSIREMNIALPNAEHDLRAITDHWNENEISFIEDDNSMQLLYDRIYIHYFISPSYFNLSGIQITQKMLNVNSLNRPNKNANRIFLNLYFNSQDADMNFREYAAASLRANFETEGEMVYNMDLIYY